MNSDKELLTCINICSSILTYKVNDNVPLGIVYDYLELNPKCYTVLCGGKKVSDNYEVKTGEVLVFFKNFAKGLESVI